MCVLLPAGQPEWELIHAMSSMADDFGSGTSHFVCVCWRIRRTLFTGWRRIIWVNRLGKRRIMSEWCIPAGMERASGYLTTCSFTSSKADGSAHEMRMNVERGLLRLPDDEQL